MYSISNPQPCSLHIRWAYHNRTVVYVFNTHEHSKACQVITLTRGMSDILIGQMTASFRPKTT